MKDTAGQLITGNGSVLNETSSPMIFPDSIFAKPLHLTLPVNCISPEKFPSGALSISSKTTRRESAGFQGAGPPSHGG